MDRTILITLYAFLILAVILSNTSFNTEHFKNYPSIYYHKYRNLQDKLTVTQTELNAYKNALSRATKELTFCKRYTHMEPTVAKWIRPSIIAPTYTRHRITGNG
jgi:hypothetical protein